MALSMWAQAGIGLLVGLIPGLLLFEWLASPLGLPLWKLTEPFARIFMTVSQFIRGAGVVVKTKEGNYEIGTYLPDKEEVQLSDRTIEVDADNLRWGLFGRKPFGITWEPGTDFHNRIANVDELVPDGGDTNLSINMGAAHRRLEGANDADAISRTEEHAKAEHGGGSDAFSDAVMAGLIILMLLMGSGTAYLMVA